ncbi:MAG: fructose-bisphosphatase class III [Lachnospiraceae bacterium]|nr:fructose-bisphosphatase class III [Lachnospiraceae bacterium]
MATYVLSDIHGLHDKFMNMLEKIDFTEFDTMYILGDVIDRGPDGIKSYQYIMNHKNIHVLKGNHEAFFLSAFSKRMESIHSDESDLNEILFQNSLWIDFNGGFPTFQAFIKLDTKEQKRIYDYIKQEKEYELIEVNHHQYLLIHAGLNLTDDLSLQEILKRDISRGDHLWIREDFLCSKKRIENKTIIFGHTPTPMLLSYYLDPISVSTENALRCKYAMIYHGDGKIDIDCGCAGNLNLGCLCLDDFEEFYI